MNRRTLSALKFAAIFICATARGADLFSDANQSYASGNDKQAASSYEDLVRAGQGNAPVYYNLGNSYFRLHDFGHAILNYERALALEPNHPEAKTNLSTARDEAHALELQSTWRDEFQRFARPNQYTFSACALFWVGAFLVVSSVGRSGRRRSRVIAALVLLILSGSLAFLLFPIESGPRGAKLAIVTNGETQARLATADTAANVLTLPVGSEVKIEEKRGDWAYALLPNGMHGWVPLRQVEFVRI
jgi:tetratricopeptide (TPR) repeat protein